jgi:hypothetical protein
MGIILGSYGRVMAYLSSLSLGLNNAVHDDAYHRFLGFELSQNLRQLTIWLLCAICFFNIVELKI